MKFNLKNILSAPSRNGYSMAATLLIDGVTVCRMRDIGDGSEPSFDIENIELFAKWEASLAELPEMFIPDYGCNVKIDKCMFIDMLHYALETKTDFKLLAA